MDIAGALAAGFLEKVKAERDIIQKEVKEAGYDLKRANQAIEEDDFKWAIVKAYYCMFHAGRALLFSLGYKERRHFVIGVVLEELNKAGKIEGRYVVDFAAAMSAREDADYRYTYSEETALYIVDIAEEFLNRIKDMLR